jgi:Uma2 family endonuclease
MEKVRIPPWVVDLDSFRRWARSDDYPEHGGFSFFNGELWVDLGMEQLFSHNRVKTRYNSVLDTLTASEDLGYYFSDNVLLSHPDAGLSTEPDGTFISYSSLSNGRVRLMKGADEGYVELMGSPDMVLEVVSSTSVRKDTEMLRDLYWRAGISEYWLVDARQSPLRFDILRSTARRYVATRRQGGWLKSAVFGRSFQLTQQTDRLGHPQYHLAMQA